MKTINHITLTVFLIFALVACSAPLAATAPAVMETPAPAVVEFADPVLEAMVRAAIGQPEGDITLARAQAVTAMNLNQELQGYLTEVTPITYLNGLQAFSNLESLDLSNHAVVDISPLQGLTSLTALSLAGNPVADVSPLAGLTNLKVLILSGSQAQDYSVLSGLVNLQVLMLDQSTITDLSPLTGLTNLRQLSLADTTIDDLSPLETIYPNLEKKDFLIPSTLIDLGFNMDFNEHVAKFDSDTASFIIHHEAWGPPSREDDQNIVRTSMYLNNEIKAYIGYYGVHKVYVCQLNKEGQPQVNYIYDPAEGSVNLNAEDRLNAEQVIRAAIDVKDGEDVLLAPFRLFDEIVKNTFNMTAEKLFAMPYEPLTLKVLGFVPDETDGIFMYEQHEGIYTNIKIDHTDNVAKEYDVVFFQPISDEYRVNMFYHAADKKLMVGADDNNMGGASFWVMMDSSEHIDEWCSDKEKTVEEYFITAYNDPAIEDVYLHSVDLMEQYLQQAFGLTVEELFALPTGEYSPRD